jgi:eukaryotic-like serine/threonine-protein kinase
MINKQRNLYEFDQFRIDPARRQLLRDNRPVPLQPKAFDVLLALVQQSAAVVSKDDLLRTVWPGTYVEESNLSQTIFVLRRTLGDSAEKSRYIVTVPGRGYCFAEKVNVIAEKTDHEADDKFVVRAHTSSHILIEQKDLPAVRVLSPRQSIPRSHILAAVVVLIALGGTYFYLHRTPPLTSKDTIVLGDFANSTGDAVFDDTLKQGLGVALRQSPFLNILSDDKVNATLKRMTKPAGIFLSKEIAHEICLRNSSAAFISGSIAAIGDTYVLGLEALNCQTGETIAAQQETARSKQNVMSALGRSASALRRELGESLTSMQKFDVPLEQATTFSLDALKAYTQGQRAQREGDDAGARDLYLRAVQLDPNFARAYAALATNYSNLSQTDYAFENYEKAFALRDRVTNRERYYIEATYYSNVTGETDRAIHIYQEWIANYPQDATPHFNIAAKYGTIGQFEQATQEMLAAMKLEPDDAGGYGVLIGFYLDQNRLDDAKRTEQEATARHLGGYVLREKRYDLAFLNNDEAGMRAQVAANGNSKDYLLLNVQANTEAYYGKYRQSRESWTRGVEAATRDDSKPMAAAWQALAAQREAEIGNFDLARKDALAALTVSSSRPVQIRAAIAFARAGDSLQAQHLADALGKQYPLDTVIQNYTLPVVRAAICLNNHDPSKAVDVLKVVESSELGSGPSLYPIYLRGLAHLEIGHGDQAAREFQKILAHRGLTLNHLTGALAHLQFARAQVKLGDLPTARKSYQEFLTVWKDADSDIPVLKQAKTEYAKLN